MKFKDVTSIYPNIVATCSNNGYGPEIVRVYENESSRIIYSFNDQGKHLSLSNPSRKVTKLEIEYSLREIMKINPGKITSYMSVNGVYHFKQKSLNQDKQYAVSDILQ